MQEAPEFLRTYKVGLRVPESLLKEQNELVLEREVLRDIKRIAFDKKKSKLQEKLDKSKVPVRKKYERACEKFNVISTLPELRSELNKNTQSLASLHRKNPALNSPRFNAADLPAFQSLDKPTPGEISITDYQNLAKNSLKMLCKHLNDRVLQELQKVPQAQQQLATLAFQVVRREGKRYSLNQLQNRLEIAIACITGVHSNIGRTAFYQLGMAFKGHFDLRDKVNFVESLLNPPDHSKANFSKEIPILLSFYSIPNHLRKYISRAWNVDAQWVRNTLVGWRRKLDALLPIRFQVEPLTQAFLEIADNFKKYSRNENDVKVISVFQKKKLLHLLPRPEVDLTPLLSEQLRPNYRYLQARIKNAPKSLKQHVHSIKLSDFVAAADELISDVRTTMRAFPSDSQPHKNCQTFINKLQFIQKEVSSQQYQAILKNYIVGNQFTSNIAKLLASSKYSRLFTALRGVISLTLAKQHPSAIGQFQSAFTPDICLTLPFTSKSRVKSHLPVNLLFNKFIVERKAAPSAATYLINQHDQGKANVTDIFKQGSPIWLGLPVYSPHQEVHFVELLTGQRKTVRKKGTFWFQLKPSKKIITCLARGAEVRDIRLNVPRGPINKIVADIVLSAKERASFRHEGKFLTAWDNAFGVPNVPKHDFLGVDFNRIGKYLVAIANPDQEIDILALMDLYKATHEKLEKFRKQEIPHIQSKLDKGKNGDGQSLSLKKEGRLRSQVTLLHRKQERLMKEMKRHALMLYLYFAWKSECKYLSWDSIGGISTRGKKGALAQAITYLPKSRTQFTLFTEWAADLLEQGYLQNYEATIPVSPFNSQVCGHCFKQTGRREKTRMKGIPYDDFRCNSCGKSSNRHSNSAQVSALLCQNQVHSKLIS
jgi:hypothetical protein